MKTRFLFVLLIFFNWNLLAVTEITKENLLSVTKEYTIVFSNFPCDMMGRYNEVYAETVKKIPGLNYAWVNVNSANSILGQSDSFMLVKDGKVIDSNKFWFANNELLVWLHKLIKKHNLPFHPEILEDIFTSPLNDTSPANLDNSFLAYYPLKTDLKDANGNFSDMQTKQIKVQNGMIYLDGDYDRTHAALYKPKDFSAKNSQTVFMNGAGISINFRPEKKQKSHRQYLFTLGMRQFGFYLDDQSNELVLNVGVSCGNCGDDGKKIESYEDFQYQGVKLEMDKWYNFVISINPLNRRISILLNGKRLKDAVLSKEFQAYLNKILIHYDSDYQTMMLKFGHYGSGVVSTGYAKDIVYYNRTLNANEMIALHKKYGDASTFNPVKPEVAPQELAKLDLALMRAAKDGDLEGLKKAYEQGGNVNTEYKKWTALLYAAFHGNEEAVKFLIEKNANVLYEFKSGWNAEKLAKYKGHNSIAQLLETASNSSAFFAQRRFAPDKKERAIIEPPK